MLRAIHTPGPKHVVRGQYGRGFVEGDEVPGYREEAGRRARLADRDVRRGEALRRQLALGRHAVLRPRRASGSRKRETAIAIQFQQAPHPPFEDVADEGLRPNVLVIHVQPDEGVSLEIGAKVPGQGMTIRTVHMDFLYGGAFRTGAAGGVRAADPRRDARRRHALHAHGRGRGAVEARRRDRRALAARPAELPELRRRHVGAARGPTSCVAARRPAPGGRHVGARRSRELERLDRRGHVRRARSSAQLERSSRLSRRPAEGPQLRTSVLTHLAWVPPSGSRRRASRWRGWPSGIRRARSLLLPDRTRTRTRSTPTSSLRCFVHERPAAARLLRGARAAAAREPRRSRPRASSRRSSLPTCRCSCAGAAGPPSREPRLRRLIDLVDRLIVDSTEWPDVPAAYGRAGGASSTGPPSRTSPGAAASRWRRQLASLWPGIAEVALPPRRRAAARSACLLAAGCARGSSHRVELEHEDAPADGARSRSTARRSTAPRGRPAVARATCSPTSSSSSGATRSTRLQRVPPRRDLTACARSRTGAHAAPTP